MAGDLQWVQLAPRESESQQARICNVISLQCVYLLRHDSAFDF